MAQDTRARMISGAARMVGSKGARSTSLRDLAHEAGVPIGSTYHHFPGGKQQLVDEAVRAVGGHIDRIIASARADGVESALASLTGEWRRVLTGSDFRTGCAVLAVATEDDDGLRRTAMHIFDGWQTEMAGILTDAGVPAQRAPQLARMIVAAVEGAVALCRAERSTAPLDDVADELRLLIGTATVKSPRGS
jgi:AcrR family transcriptional regulator